MIWTCCHCGENIEGGICPDCRNTIVTNNMRLYECDGIKTDMILLLCDILAQSKMVATRPQKDRLALLMENLKELR